MSSRTIVNHHTANHMIRMYNEVKDITDSGGVAYETKSAIWAFSPMREMVTLFVKEPQPNMSNQLIDYVPSSKNYEKHKARILRLTGAKPIRYKY